MLNLHEAVLVFFFFSSRRRHTRYWRDWSSDVCSSDLTAWSWRSALPLGGGPLVDDGPGDAGDLVVGEPDGALGVDPVDDRVQPSHGIGQPAGGIVVRGVVERLDDGPGGGVATQPGTPGLLQRIAGEQRARAHAGVAALLVVPAGDVVA